MPYIGKSPSAVGVRNRFYFTASGGETSLSGSDDNGKTLVFSDASYVDVILNGGNLVSGTDYTATPSTNTISGLTALVANDVVEIIAYDVFSVSDTVSAASGGTFQSNVNFDSGIDVTGNATFADNGKAIFGAGSDLQIYSNGSSSFIQEGGSGELNILGTDIYFINSANNEYLATFTTDGGVSLRYDNSTKLATTSTGVDITGTVTMDGASTSGDITFGDNNKAIFGAGSDLQIYHNGTSASYITDQGTGNLVLGGDIAIILQNSAHNANMLDAYNGGRVGLYHANSLKLATTATGVDVTGTVTADGLTAYSGVADAESRLIKFGYSSVGDWALTRDNAATGDFYVQSGVSGTYTTRATYHLNGDISFYDSLGSSQSFFWDASTQRLGLGTTSPAVKLAVQNDSSTAFNPSTAAFNTVATLKNNTGGASTNALLSFATEANGEWYIGGVQNSGNTAADFVFAGRNGGTRAERMRIDSNGNLIIGATYSGAPGSITLQSDGDISGILASGAGGDTLISAIYGVSNGYQISVDTSNNQTYKWHNGGTQSMTLDSRGNLGIGITPSAPYRLQVNVGTNTVTTGSPADSTMAYITGGTTTVGDGVSLQIGNFSGVKETSWRISAVTTSGNNGDLLFNGYAGGADYPERLRITSAGNVGIGITSPEARLDVLGNSDVTAALKIGPNANFGHHFYDSSTNGDLVIKREVSGVQTETMRLTRSGGYVGIGHNVPTAKGLQIRGQGRVFNNTIWDPYNDNTASVNDRSILYVESNSNAAADYGSSIGFRGRAGITVDYVTFATIAGVKENSTTDGSASYSTQVQGCLDFYTAEGYDFSPNYAVRQQRRMRIDSRGRVTMPYQPAFSARKSAGQSSSSSPIDPITFGATTVNVGNHFDTSTSQFTAPVAGTYWFAFALNVYRPSSSYISIQCRVNGSTPSGLSFLEYASTSWTCISAGFALSLSANDAVKLIATFDATSSLDNSGYFSGYLIG